MGQPGKADVQVFTVLFRLLLLFIGLPLVELALLFWIAEHTGWVATLVLIFTTGIVGASLARHEGIRCWREIQESLHRGELPADRLLDGLLILLAGAVLITPGVITDAIGFSLLVAPVRKAMRQYLARRIQAHIIVSTRSGFQCPGDDSDVIDVDWPAAEDRDK
jgi:UPF0716 protein FxsA